MFFTMNPNLNCFFFFGGGGEDLGGKDRWTDRRTDPNSPLQLLRS